MRKMLVLALVVVVGLFVLRKTELGGLLRVWWHDGKAGLEAAIPPETRIKQLRLEIAQIDKRLEKATREQTKLEIRYEDVQHEVAALKEKQSRRDGEMKAMLTALDGESNLLTFEGKTIEVAELQKRLDRTTTDYTTDKKTLKALSEILESRKKVVDASDARIKQLRVRQLELSVIVERAEAQLALVRLKQSENRSAVEGNELVEAERLLKLLDRNLREEEKLQEIQARHGLTPVRPDSPRPSLEESKQAARQALAQDE